MVTVAGSNTSGRGLPRTGVLLVAVVGLLLGLLVAMSPAASTGFAADIAVGTNFACGATQAGHVSCWGNNQYGQLGNGTSGNGEPYPVRVKGGAQGGKWLTGVTQLAAGGDHMCALTDDGSLFCWGSNDRGQLGTDSQQDAAKPKKVDLPGVISVARSQEHLRNSGWQRVLLG